MVDNRKHEQGTHFFKRDADSFVENTPKLICPICLSKSLEFQWKNTSLGVHIPWWKLELRYVDYFDIIRIGIYLYNMLLFTSVRNFQFWSFGLDKV